MPPAPISWSRRYRAESAPEIRDDGVVMAMRLAPGAVERPGLDRWQGCSRDCRRDAGRRGRCREETQYTRLESPAPTAAPTTYPPALITQACPPGCGACRPSGSRWRLSIGTDTPLAVPIRLPTITSVGKCWSALTRRLPVNPASSAPTEATATCSAVPAPGRASRLSVAA